MSPSAVEVKPKSQSREPTAPVSPPVPQVPLVPLVPLEAAPEAQPITLLSPLDSYIRERMKEQPKTMEEIESRAQVQEIRARHRLQLPEFFHRLSADNPQHAGPYIFRWIFKDKRAVDSHLAKGWSFVNRSLFPQAPRYFFSANGGVEIGDLVLGFMPARQALELRFAPAKLSQERIRGQMTATSADKVMMTGNPKNEHVYEPELGPESAEMSEEKVPGVLTQGRDFE